MDFPFIVVVLSVANSSKLISWFEFWRGYTPVVGACHNETVGEIVGLQVNSIAVALRSAVAASSDGWTNNCEPEDTSRGASMLNKQSRAVGKTNTDMTNHWSPKEITDGIRRTD